MTDEKPRDIPTAEQLAAELKRIRYKKDYRKVLVNTMTSLAIVTAIAVLISVVCLPVIRVTGQSMSPVMLNDDFVICSKGSSFERGDIIAFNHNNKILLKRVIGTAGDVIDIKEDGTVYLNDELLDEPYVSEKALGECNITMPYTVPLERVFVMGDQRETSIDSRSTTIGCISSEFIIGKVVLRIWPFKRMGVI